MRGKFKIWRKTCGEATIQATQTGKNKVNFFEQRGVFVQVGEGGVLHQGAGIWARGKLLKAFY